MASPSLTNSSDQFKYDVYLSFRGADTRFTFVAHLYHALKSQGIRAFLDDAELERGDQISESLSRAREESNIFLIIFSEQYASSQWCLEELVEIMKLWETRKYVSAVPVFYRIDPSDVEVQTGPFEHAFNMHIENGADEHTVRRWRDALRLASQLSGWESMNYRNDAILMEEIVKHIWGALDKPSQSPSVETGDSQSHIDMIMSLLQLGSTDVRIIGIKGNDGIGKTTIVKDLFRQIWDMFQRFYFFTNVKEEVRRSVVDRLRDNLLLGSLGEESLEVETLSFGLAFRKDRVHRLKVLLILEDVEEPRDIQELIADRKTLFGSGSRILITSRNTSVFQNLDAVYKVKRMNDNDSEKLFRSIAPNRNYNLFKFLRQINGNPLAIKVLASALRAKNDLEWDSALEKLDKLPRSIHNVLRYSYDLLKEEEKKVFLDVACFFVGESWDDATRILNDHYSSIRIILRTLIDRSLISVSNDKLEMHDLLQEMAWTIVREELSTERGRRSNLWNPENLYHLLNKQKGWMMLGCSSSLCLISL